VREEDYGPPYMLPGYWLNGRWIGLPHTSKGVLGGEGAFANSITVVAP